MTYLPGRAHLTFLTTSVKMRESSPRTAGRGLGRGEPRPVAIPPLPNPLPPLRGREGARQAFTKSEMRPAGPFKAPAIDRIDWSKSPPTGPGIEIRPGKAEPPFQSGSNQLNL